MKQKTIAPVKRSVVQSPTDATADPPPRDPGSNGNDKSTSAGTQKSKPPSTNQSTDDASPVVAAARKSAQNTTPQDPETSTTNATADLNLCQNAYMAGQTCCGSPQNCLSESQKQQYGQLMSTINDASQNSADSGLTASCAQMQASSGALRDANNLLAGVCATKQSQCDTTCSMLITKYQSMLNSCGDCDSQSVIQNAVQSLGTTKARCESLTAQLDQLAGQGLANTYGSDAGNNCAQASSNGSGMGGLSPASAGQGSSASAASGSSASSPDASATNQAVSAASERGMAGLLGATSNAINKFNLGDNGDPTQGGTRLPQGVLGQSTTPRVGEIPNNSGGGFTSGAGHVGSGLSGGGSGRGAGSGYAATSTDIDRGYRSGGYTPGVAGMPPDEGTPEQRMAREKARAETLALAQYLPGASRDPAAIIMGMTKEQAEAKGIHGKYTNIFEKVTDRIRAKCALKELWDCNGEETQTGLKQDPLPSTPPPGAAPHR